MMRRRLPVALLAIALSWLGACADLIGLRANGVAGEDGGDADVEPDGSLAFDDALQTGNDGGRSVVDGTGGCTGCELRDADAGPESSTEPIPDAGTDGKPLADAQAFPPTDSGPPPCNTCDASTPSPDACDKGNGFCTETLQCDNGHWIVRQDDPTACTTVDNVAEPCSVGNGYCTATLQCEGGQWVDRANDPTPCTSGPGV